MARVAFLAACITGACQAADIPDAFLGSWTPVDHTVQAILGPVTNPTLTVQKDKSNGDHWISYLPGQVFRVREMVMEYCFAHIVQSPFMVNNVTDNLVHFCYKTDDRMATHRAADDGTLATGCGAAEILLELRDDGTLEFTFYMSRPVRHAWAIYKKVGPAPAVATYIASGGKCDPLKPGPPTLGSPLHSSMCPALNFKRKHLELARQTTEDSKIQEDGQALEAGFGKGGCRKLDGGMLGMGQGVNIKLSWTKPKNRCWPCKVSYTLSAKIAEDEYIALGFKGMAYRALSHHKREQRPNYFGMSTDEIDEERTGKAMVLGYAGGSAGSCVRQMESKNYVGEPTDVEGNPDISNESVERKNGRTIIKFTVEQHVGKNRRQVKQFFNTDQFSARTMWAIGEIKGSDCAAAPQMHRARGVSPFSWFSMNPKCHFGEEDELDESNEVVV